MVEWIEKNYYKNSWMVGWTGKIEIWLGLDG